MAVIKDGTPITTLEQWEKRAGPKRADQWREGRSAMETARAWLAAGGCLPAEVLEAIQQHPEFGEIRNWQAEPEVCLRFDGFRGEPRNSDLVVNATDDHGTFLVAVERRLMRNSATPRQIRLRLLWIGYLRNLTRMEYVEFISWRVRSLVRAKSTKSR